VVARPGRDGALSYWSTPVSGTVLAIVAIPCITFIIVLRMVLRFSKTMVDINHGDTKCLRDVAILLRAFRGGAGSLLGALARVIGRR
jgi:hypothetical protein